jgi:RNA polymerase sigma factor (sigma-70 family)
MATAQLGTLLRHIQELAAGGGQQQSDRQLVDDFAARGSEAAFGELVSRHGAMVLRVCRRVLRHEQDAEDAFQATFLVLARKAASICRREALAAWLHGVAYRTALRAKRGAARRRNHEAQLRAAAPRAASPVWDDVQAVLDEEIRRLPPRFRAAFVLSVLEGMSGSEAAADLGCKVGTVKSRVNRARQQLRRRLVRRGIDLSTVLAALTLADGAGQAAVPAALLAAVIRFGLLVAAGEPAAGVIPLPIAALAAGVTRAMFLTKAKNAIVILLVAGLLATGAGVLTRRALAGKAQEAAPAAKAAQPASEKKPAPPKGAGAADKDSLTLSGQVLGPDSKPFAGAKLYQAFWVEFIEGNPPPAPRVRGTSDRDGRFQFAVPREELVKHPKAVLQVVAAADGFGPDWVRIDQADARALTLRLVKDDVPITGRILDLEGRPIRGATIHPMVVMTTREEDLTPWLQAIKDKKRFQHRDVLTKQVIGFPHGIPGLPPTITTGADGRFRLTGVGRERVMAAQIGGPKVRGGFVMVVTREVPKFQAFDNPVTDTKLTVYGATFEHVVAPAKPMTGTVRDKDTGKPLAGVKIEAGPSLPVFTDREGKYRFESLPGDDRGDDTFGIPVLAIPPADQPYLVGFKEVRPAAGLEATTVDFPLKRGVWVGGKVTDKVTGKPVRAHIQYHPAADNPHRGEAADFTRFPSLPRELYPTRPDGTFRVAALPGPGAVTARGPYGEYIGDGSVAINPTRDTDSVQCEIVLDPGRMLTGTVLDPDGKPLAGVHVFNMNPLHFWTSRPLPAASFRLTAMDPRGRRSLVFLHTDRHLVKAVELEGNAKDPITVRLEPAGTVTGRLVDEDGQPRSGVDLRIHFVRKDTDYVALHLPEQIKTDPQGRFRIEGLAPGVVYQINLAGKPPNFTIGSVAPRVSIKPGESKHLGDVKGKLFQE